MQDMAKEIGPVEYWSEQSGFEALYRDKELIGKMRNALVEVFDKGTPGQKVKAANVLFSYDRAVRGKELPGHQPQGVVHMTYEQAQDLLAGLATGIPGPVNVPESQPLLEETVEADSA